LVVIAILSVLAALLLPALAGAQDQARAVQCMNNLKQITVALHLYASDNRDYLVPAEYDRANGAPYQDGWPAILVHTRYLSAPVATRYDHPASGPSVFRCPSGLPQVATFVPVSRSDPEGARARPYLSRSNGGKAYVHCWYGINGSTGRPERYPFVRIPDDRGVIVQNKLSSVAASSSSMPAVLDGFWILNGYDARVNARHRRATRTNLAFFDGSVRSYVTARIPSLASTNDSEIRWRY
ncbi:MAG: DUF1559 domain-containing protein, partial [Verrucomicrobia bacterium]|nr:DUF1559 domain-containing protein [Verrucomicrobiota bacterium]